MKKTQILLFSLFVECSLIVFGCALSPVQMYPGPPRLPHEVALVKVVPDLWMFSLDDCNRPARLAEILPGRHSYVVALCKSEPWGPQTEWPYRWDTYQGYGWHRYWGFDGASYLYTKGVTLEFEAIASHQYRVGFNLWIVHEDSSKEPYHYSGFFPLPRGDRLECEFQVLDSTSKEIVARASALVKSTCSICCPYAAGAGKRIFGFDK